MSNRRQITIEMVDDTCWCGCPFSFPAEMKERQRFHQEAIYCPKGHKVVYAEMSELDNTRRERDRLKQDAARLQEEIEGQRVRARLAEAQAEKHRRDIGKLKKRASAGTCPCCNRTFGNMATHMRKQHPEFVAENVVRLKASG